MKSDYKWLLTIFLWILLFVFIWNWFYVLIVGAILTYYINYPGGVKRWFKRKKEMEEFENQNKK